MIISIGKDHFYFVFLQIQLESTTLHEKNRFLEKVVSCRSITISFNPQTAPKNLNFLCELAESVLFESVSLQHFYLDRK